MGTVTTTITPIAAGSPKTLQSKGGVRLERLVGKHLMGATYATGGDTVTKPGAPPGATLLCVHILATPNLPVGIDIVWDGGTSTVKLLAYDEDNTSGVAAELSNGNAALVAQVVWLEWIYSVGI